MDNQVAAPAPTDSILYRRVEIISGGTWDNYCGKVVTEDDGMVEVDLDDHPGSAWVNRSQVKTTDTLPPAPREMPAEDERESKPVHWDLIREAFAQGFTYGSAEYLADNFTGGEDSWDQATQAAFGLWESDPENNMTPKMRAALHLREGRPTDSCPNCGARYFDG